MARRTGIEPVPRDSKSRVLPLDDQRINSGVPARTQTSDLRLRTAALSFTELQTPHLVGREGIEPPTSRVRTGCSAR